MYVSFGSPYVESTNWVILTREDYLDPLHLWVISNQRGARSHHLAAADTALPLAAVVAGLPPHRRRGPRRLGALLCLEEFVCLPLALHIAEEEVLLRPGEADIFLLVVLDDRRGLDDDLILWHHPI